MRIYRLFLFLVALSTAPQLSKADEETIPVRLEHTPSQGNALPFPSSFLPVEVKALNFSKFTTPLRVFIVRDGVASYYTIPKGTLDVNDNTVYQLNLLAPKEEIFYEFILPVSNKSTVIKKFRIRRGCLPDVSPALPEGDERQKDPLASELQKRAIRLDQEVTAYETSAKMLEEIDNILQKYVSSEAS